MKNIIFKAFRRVRFTYLRLMRIKAPPHATALGLALGVFVGFLPIIPIQTVVAVGLAFVFKCGKIAAAVGTWVTNPFNVPIVYYSLYKVGSLILPFKGPDFNASKLSMAELLQSGWRLFSLMSVGGLVVGVPCALATYFISLQLIRRFHALRAKRRARKIG